MVWTKPELGLVAWNGSTANNIVIDAGDVDGNRGFVLDAHEKDAIKRFKMLGGMNASGGAAPCSWASRNPSKTASNKINRRWAVFLISSTNLPTITHAPWAVTAGE